MKPLILLAFFLVQIQMYAQIEKKSQKAIDGTEWYLTIDNSHTIDQANKGIIIHDKQIVPCNFFGCQYITERKGIHFFSAAYYFKDDKGDYCSSLFNCDGEEIVSYKQGISYFSPCTFNEHNYIMFTFVKNGKYGALDGVTGKIIVEPIYDNLTYIGGNFEVLTDDNRSLKVPYNKSNITDYTLYTSSNSKTNEIYDDFMRKGGWYYADGNYKEALKCFEKAMEYDNERAYYQAGLTHEKLSNYEEAVKCYRKAAEKGHPKAQKQLGWCYLHGRGVKKDSIEALKWIVKAANNEEKEAMVFLAYLEIENGNIEKGTFWAEKAAKLGNPEARALLEQIKSGTILEYLYKDLYQ